MNANLPLEEGCSFMALAEAIDIRYGVAAPSLFTIVALR